MGKRRVHYVLSSHWDREWHQSFQDFRYRLVQLLDRVIDGLCDGRLRGPFTADGQAIMLEDYLEIRPDRRAVVEHLTRQGQIVVGPWYVLPDEFLVSGESLIRNIQLGRAVARSLGGEPSNAGFVCDLFGHNSQMPQILAAFGIGGGFLWRGLNHTSSRHVRWRGADGTELPCYRFGHRGYSSYADTVRHAFEPDHAFDAEGAREDLESYLRAEVDASEIEPILLFDGGDHQEWDQDVYDVLLHRMEQDDDEYDIVHSSLDAYLNDVIAERDSIASVVEGELRDPGYESPPVDEQWLIPGVLSSRAWIKQWNARCETLLCQWAEPMSALASSLLGREYPDGFLDVAWKWLLKNHPHDSICGCSVDRVHEDMRFRFNQSEQIAERLTQEATRKIAASVTATTGSDDLRIVLFNPLPQPFGGTTEATVQTPIDWPTFNEFFGFEPKPAFGLWDAAGDEVPYQRLGQFMGRQRVRLRDCKFPQSYSTNDVTVSLNAHVPAMGYTTFTVRPGEPGHPTRHPSAIGLATSERSVANEHLEVTIEANGTLTLVDKRNGEVYSRLLTFEDTADIGDGWYHGVAANDEAFVSSASSADVALVHNGPMLTTFRVRVHLRVPDEMSFGPMVRSDGFAELHVDSLVSLRPGSDFVEVESTVHNNARDHRLRVLLPTGARAETYLADSQFDVVERPVALREDNHLYRELEVETRPQQSWTAVSDPRRGLAVVSSGLLETSVRDLPERPIALTLLRATRRTVMTNGEPLGQLQGPSTFRYWIVPLQGQPDRVRLCGLGQRIAAGLRDVQLTLSDIVQYRAERALPAQASRLALEGSAVLSSMRQVGKGLEIRLFNPLNEVTQATLRFGTGLISSGYSSVCRVDLEGRPTRDPQPFQPHIEMELSAKQIVTLLLS